MRGTVLDPWGREGLGAALLGVIAQLGGPWAQPGNEEKYSQYEVTQPVSEPHWSSEKRYVREGPYEVAS